MNDCVRLHHAQLPHGLRTEAAVAAREKCPVARGHEPRRGEVAQSAVRSPMVVLQPIVLAHHLRPRQAREPITIQQFVAEPTIEQLAVRILPRSARLGDRPSRDPAYKDCRAFS